MPGTVVTLVASHLDATTISAVSATLYRLAGGTVVPEMLDEGRAVDLLLPETPAQANLLQAIRLEFQNISGIDVFVQPQDGNRRKRLLVADMDATIVIGETLDEVAAHLGLADQITPITARAMRGELDFAEALRARVALLKGMPAEALDTIRGKITPSPGAAVLVRTMAAHGSRCVLASGGFDVFTGSVAARLGFHAHFGNRLVIDATMRATGEVSPPILDKNTKTKILQDEANKLGVSPAAVIAVGDGANDVPMLQAAGVGVAYHAKPLVNAATSFHVRHGDLTALLYLQGYKRSEWAVVG